ncbi:MAG: nickel insertion protein, partial [Acidimicrobiales bacterium]
MTTVAWWHCFSGIAGDMALGSLVDAGADLTSIERDLVALPVGGWSLDAVPVMRAGLACTQAVVSVRDTSVVRTYAHIEGMLTEARLPERARSRALAAFGRLAD